MGVIIFTSARAQQEFVDDLADEIVQDIKDDCGITGPFRKKNYHRKYQDIGEITISEPEPELSPVKAYE